MSETKTRKIIHRGSEYSLTSKEQQYTNNIFLKRIKGNVQLNQFLKLKMILIIMACGVPLCVCVCVCVCIYVCSCAKMAELGICDRDHMACKA